MKLDEIEAQVRTLCGAAPTQDGYVRGDVEAAGNIALALVAHVRALDSIVRLGNQTGSCRAAEAALARITALEERVEELSRNAGEDFDRVTALGDKVAALEHGSEGGGAASAVEEVTRLREENAELRKRQCELPHCRCLTWAWAGAHPQPKGHHPHCDGDGNNNTVLPQWPAPQPIETAPLGEILAGPAPNGFAWAPERPLAGCSLEHWRTQLREAERRWWLPMPPPGGATWAREDVKAGEAPKGHHPRCVLPYAPAPDPQENAALKQENAALKQANDNVQAVAREYEERIKELQADVSRLRGEKEALQKTLDRYSQARARAEERLEAQQKFLLESCRGYDVDRLGKVIETLKSLPPDLVLPVGLSNPHSYRGYYEQLAFEPKENVSVEECLKVAKSCVDKTFTGYKGGDYMMTEDTSCWLCTYGNSGGVQLSAFLIRLLAGMNLAYRS